MKNIIKVQSLENLPETRPLLAMDNAGILFVEGNVVGPQIEMVDLGLPSGILWATNNIGAKPGLTPESYYGNYYAWGETETKSNYTWATYEHCTPDYDPDKSVGSLTKYTDSDGKTVLEAVDDVATQIYGSDYHIPTKTEIEELLAGTTSSWVVNYNNIEGLKGKLFTSKVNSNTLFIPTAGYYNGSDIILAGSGCYLLSSSLLLSDLSRASILELELSDIYITHRSRYFGFSIRPVIKL